MKAYKAIFEAEEKVTVKVKMTKKQANELQRYAEFLRKDYENGEFDFDIKRCIKDYNWDWLFRNAMAGAFGWFSNKNIPFACVYKLIDDFVNAIREKYKH